MGYEMYRHLSKEDVIRYRLRLLREVQEWGRQRNVLMAVEQAHDRSADVAALHRSLGQVPPNAFEVELAVQEEFDQAGNHLLSLFDKIINAYCEYDGVQPPPAV